MSGLFLKPLRAWDYPNKLPLSPKGDACWYNANGIRTSKTVNGVTHEYILDGSNILCEKWGNTTLTPLYNVNEEVCGILLNDGVYYFVKNLQGDVIAITDSRGNTVAKYSYDAWGKCTITEDGSGNNIASINPYRYRSYYYDSEIDMYYLQSRYYDANVGRFINADESIFAIGENAYDNNLFTYCKNDAINHADFSGNISYRYAVSKSWFRRTGSATYNKTAYCLKDTFAYKISFSCITGYYSGIHYSGLNKFTIKVVRLPKNHKLSRVEYYYGSTNIFLEQNGSGRTTKSTFTKTIPSNWLMVNIVSYESIKANIGVTVEVYIKPKYSNSYYYILEFTYTTRECGFDFYKKVPGKKKVLLEFCKEI